MVSAERSGHWHWLDCIGHVPPRRGGPDLVSKETGMIVEEDKACT